MNNSSPNSQILTIWGFVLVFAAAILFFVSRGQFVFATLVVATIVVLLVAREPEKWWLAAIMFFNSTLKLPGTSGNITASLAASIGFVGLSIMLHIFHRTAKKPAGIPRQFAAWLVLLLVCLASYRGWGLRVLGGSNWGGMQYIQLIGALTFFVFSRELRVDEKTIVRAAILFFSLGLLPSFLTIFIKHIPSLTVLQSIVSIGNAAEVDIGDPISGISRMQSLHWPATLLGYLALMLFDRYLKITWKILCLLFLSFILAGLSGHRTVIVKLGMILFIYAIIRWHKIPQAIKIKTAVFGICLIALVYMATPFLPLAYQRTLSVLPGIHVDQLASRDASQTIDWRVELWRRSLYMIPDHLLMGRGLGFDLREAYGAYSLAASELNKYEFFIAVHNYHSGPLWALVDLGGVGAFLLAGFSVSAIVRYGRGLSRPYTPSIRSVYVIFYAGLISQFVFFLLAYGDYNEVIRMAVMAAVLEVTSSVAEPETQKKLSETKIPSAIRR